VDLISGEAYFTVAKDLERPFAVYAGGAVVQAVGTAFSVSLDSRVVEVLVTEGRVLINPEITVARDIAVEPSEPSVRELEAGQRSVLELAGEGLSVPLVEDVSETELERLRWWKPELVDFSGTPLRVVVRAFNERNLLRIVIADEELEDLELTASLRLNDLESFVELLELAMGIKSSFDGDSTILLRKRSS